MILTLRRVQPVLPFQFPADAVAAAEEEILIEPPAFLVHIDCHDVQVVAVYVLVLDNKIRLVPIAEFLQILACDVLQFRIGQHVVGMRIERDMEYRFLHPRMLRHTGEKALHCLADVHRPRAVIVDAVGGEQPPFRLVDLFPVIGKCAVQRLSYTDFCDHFASISLDNSTI